MPEGGSLARRYRRIEAQLADLFAGRLDPLARMATAAALLHHKMPRFSWTGFYRVLDGDLVVGPYQGPLACAVLPGREGVCWAGVMRGEPVIVPDVREFEGHVECDSRSRSEIVVPVRDAAGETVAVLDVDSRDIGAFGEEDAEGLGRICEMIYS